MYDFIDSQRDDDNSGGAPVKNNNGYVFLFFMCFIFVGALFLLNLFIGIIFLNYRIAEKLAKNKYLTD